MNAAFVASGLLTLFGALVLASTYRHHRPALVGFLCLAVGGVGSVIVGLVPENVSLDLHNLGAFLPFFVGNIGVLILGLSRSFTAPWLRIYSTLTGLVGVVAYFLFEYELYLGLGVGGMERVTDYVQVLWFVVVGVALIRRLLSQRSAFL